MRIIFLITKKRQKTSPVLFFVVFVYSVVNTFSRVITQENGPTTQWIYCVISFSLSNSSMDTVSSGGKVFFMSPMCF